MVFDDGAKYEGEFSGFGKFSGKGVLYSGDRKFDGEFRGNYSENMKFNGEITVLKDEQIRDAAAVKPNSIIPLDEKWKEIFGKWNRQIGTNPSMVWQNIVFVTGVGKTAEQMKDCLEMIPKAGQ